MSTSSSTFTAEDAVLGAKVISFSLQALSFMASIAISSTCSSVLIGFIVAVVCTIVLTLLAAVAAFFASMALGDQRLASVGAVASGIAGKFTGLFAKRAA